MSLHHPYSIMLVFFTGDNAQDYGSANVEVDGIVDETHLAQHIASNPAIDQVVEVLVQPQGGHGDTTIALTTSEVGPVGHEGYISTSRVDSLIETTEAFQNKEPAVVSATASSLQQQQQVMNAQNVIPIGNANLSGLANILQNPEVLAAINAAAASNKFIVIGPVGMLSNASTGTTNSVSLPNTYTSSGNMSATVTDSDGNITICSTEVSGSNAIVGSHNVVVQMPGVSPVDSGVTGACNVQMIAADTSQDSSLHIGERVSEASGNEVQSSVSSVTGQLAQSTADGEEGGVISEEAQVVSSQDTEMQNVICHHHNLEGEVSSSAGLSQSGKANVVETEVDGSISSGKMGGSEGGGVFYAVQQNDGASTVQPSSGQFIVAMKEQFVSSSSCTTSLSSETFIASNAMTGSGQSMVMVTADGQSYLTTVNVPDDLGGQSGSHQIVLAPADANNLNVGEAMAINSSVNMNMNNSHNNSNEASCVLLTAHLDVTSDDTDVTPGQSTDANIPQRVDLGDFTVSDSTTHACVNSSSNIQNSTLQCTMNASESSIEVSGSNNLQPDSMQSKETSNTASDSTTADSQVDQADSVIESSQVFLLASAVDGGHHDYGNVSIGSEYEAHQSAFIDASNLITASSNASADSVVSGTENFVSSDLQKNSNNVEVEKTGVTSSRDLMDSRAESTTTTMVSGSQNEDNGNDQDDSQVSTSLQI